MKLHRSLLFALCSLVPCVLPADARTWHVDPFGSGDAPTIQAGIDSAALGDTVLVACGRYTWTTQGSGTAAGLVRMKGGITLRGEADIPGSVLIDALGQGRVIYCERLEPVTRIEGITVYGGSDPGQGGGMFCRHSNIRLTRCSFVNNLAGDAGALLCVGSTVDLQGCWFTSNQAGGIGGALVISAPGGAGEVSAVACTFLSNSAGFAGGAVFLEGGAPVLTDCVFLSNRLTAWVGYGGAIYCTGSSPSLRGCVFIRNTASSTAGALYCYTMSSPAIDRCLFAGNRAFEEGGAIKCWDRSSPTITRSTFAGNAAGMGAHLRVIGGSVTVERSIMAFGEGGAAVSVYSTGSSVTLGCSDVYGNEGGDWTGAIADQFGVRGNISRDPFFCAPEADDFHLDGRSPCAPSSQPSCHLIGVHDVGCGIVANETSTWGALKQRFR